MAVSVKDRCPNRDFVAQGQRKPYQDAFQCAGKREGRQGRGAVAAPKRINRATEADSQQRGAQDQANGIGAASENGGQDSVPHHFLKQENESHDTCAQ